MKVIIGKMQQEAPPPSSCYGPHRERLGRLCSYKIVSVTTPSRIKAGHDGIPIGKIINYKNITNPLLPSETAVDTYTVYYMGTFQQWLMGFSSLQKAESFCRKTFKNKESLQAAIGVANYLLTDSIFWDQEEWQGEL